MPSIQSIRSSGNFDKLSDSQLKDIFKNNGVDVFDESESYQDAEPKDDSDFTRGFKTDLKQVPTTLYGLGAGIAATGESAFGSGGLLTGLKNAALDKYQEGQQEIAATAKLSDEWDYTYNKAKEGDLGALVDFVQYGLGHAASQGLQALGTGIGGAYAARALATNTVQRLVGEEIAKGVAEHEAVKIAAQKVGEIGSTAALAGMAAAQEGGEIGGGLAQKSRDENRTLSSEEIGKGFVSTILASGMEYAGDKLGLNALTGKLPFVKNSNALTRGAVGALSVAPAEGLTEFGQTLTEEYGKGNDPLSDESLAQARTGAALGIIGGGAMGGVGGLVSPKPQDRPSPLGEQINADAVSAPIGWEDINPSNANQNPTGNTTLQGYADIVNDNNAISLARKQKQLQAKSSLADITKPDTTLDQAFQAADSYINDSDNNQATGFEFLSDIDELRKSFAQEINNPAQSQAEVGQLESYTKNGIKELSQDQILTAASKRLAVLDANQDSLDEEGHHEREFLIDNSDNPEALAQAYGYQLVQDDSGIDQPKPQEIDNGRFEPAESAGGNTALESDSGRAAGNAVELPVTTDNVTTGFVPEYNGSNLENDALSNDKNDNQPIQLTQAADNLPEQAEQLPITETVKEDQLNDLPASNAQQAVSQEVTAEPSPQLASHTDIEDAIVRSNGRPYEKENQAQNELKLKIRNKKLNADNYDVVPVIDGFAIAPTASLSYEQFKALPRNAIYHDNLLAQSYEAETGKPANLPNDTRDSRATSTSDTVKSNVTPNGKQTDVPAVADSQFAEGSAAQGEISSAGETSQNESQNQAGFNANELGGVSDNLQSFIADKPRLKQTSITKHLTKEHSPDRDGNTTLKSVIENRIDNGWKLKTESEFNADAYYKDQQTLSNHEAPGHPLRLSPIEAKDLKQKLANRDNYTTTVRKLVSPDGEYVLGKDNIGKIGLDYAEYLESNKPSASTPKAEATTSLNDKSTPTQPATQAANNVSKSALDNKQEQSGEDSPKANPKEMAAVQDNAVSTPVYDDLKQAKSALKKAGKDTHDIIQTGDSYTVVPTESLSFEQFRSLPRNSSYSDNLLRQTYEAETGKQAVESNDSQANLNEEPQIRRGKVGDKLSQGEVVKTASGRLTTPFPKFLQATGKNAGKVGNIGLKAVDNWLMSNAITEAKERGDTFNARIFESTSQKPTQADKDSAEEYLFGEEITPVEKILKPLSSNETTQSQTQPISPNTRANQGGNAPTVGTAEASAAIPSEKEITPASVNRFNPGIAQIFKDLGRKIADPEVILLNNDVTKEQAEKIAFIQNNFNDIVSYYANEDSPIEYGIGYYESDKSDNPKNGKVFIKC